jgi:hypothetical protein
VSVCTTASSSEPVPASASVLGDCSSGSGLVGVGGLRVDRAHHRAAVEQAGVGEREHALRPAGQRDRAVVRVRGDPVRAGDREHLHGGRVRLDRPDRRSSDRYAGGCAGPKPATSFSPGEPASAARTTAGRSGPGPVRVEVVAQQHEPDPGPGQHVRVRGGRLAGGQPGVQAVEQPGAARRAERGAVADHPGAGRERLQRLVPGVPHR